jgi:hypothetical protein
MTYYRKLPFDVRVAMWADEHPMFMRGFGLACVATCIAASAVGVVSFAVWVLSS